MADAARIISRYQVTLPKQLRKDLNVAVGDLIMFIKDGDEWKIRTIPEDPVKALKFAGQSLGAGDFREVHENFEQGWEDSSRA